MNTAQHHTEKNASLACTITMPTRTPAEKVRTLRETMKPQSFDAWLCLGGEYRDMAEVDEWAPVDVKEKLLADYQAFVDMNRDS